MTPASRGLLALGGALLLASPLRAQDPTTQDLYRAKCQACHMANGNAPSPRMNLADGNWLHGSKAPQVAKVIAEGVPGTAMLPFKGRLSPEQITDLAAYVRAFDKALKVGRPSK